MYSCARLEKKKSYANEIIFFDTLGRSSSISFYPPIEGGEHTALISCGGQRFGIIDTLVLDTRLDLYELVGNTCKLRASRVWKEVSLEFELLENRPSHRAISIHTLEEQLMGVQLKANCYDLTKAFIERNEEIDMPSAFLLDKLLKGIYNGKFNYNNGAHLSLLNKLPLSIKKRLLKVLKFPDRTLLSSHRTAEALKILLKNVRERPTHINAEEAVKLGRCLVDKNLNKNTHMNEVVNLDEWHKFTPDITRHAFEKPVHFKAIKCELINARLIL